jgi:hypothetical protein
MEFWICLLCAWALVSGFLIFFLNDMRKLDIEFLKDDISRLRNSQRHATSRHHKLKDALREAVTDDE